MFQSARFCTILLLFVAQFLFAQNDEFNNLPIDTALVWLNNNIVENPDNFHERALQTLERAYALDDIRLKAEAHLLLSNWHGYTIPFTMDSVIVNEEKALVLFEKINDKDNMVFIYSNMVVDYQSQNDLKRAEESAFKAIQLYEELGQQKGVGKTYRKLAGLHIDQKELDLALKYTSQALEIAEELEDHYNTAIAQLQLIEIYTEQGLLEKAKNVSLEVDMSEIELDVDTAIPIGLKTNELITNSLKHAFQNKNDGKILITLSQEENGLLKLHIADNGQASESESNATKEKGFGSLLIQLLTTQLGGTLEKSNKSGTSTIIQFPLQEKSAA